jgi:hypothetical protein
VQSIGRGEGIDCILKGRGEGVGCSPQEVGMGRSAVHRTGGGVGCSPEEEG